MDTTRMCKNKKKTKHCLRMESMPHDVVELIMERLAVKSLVRFKAVSKQWKSTIESRFFQERQLKQRQESGDPDVLKAAVSVSAHPDDVSKPPVAISYLRTLDLRSSSSVKVPSPWENWELEYYYFVSQSSCDGLVCLYHPEITGFVFNPTTRWYRPLPLSNFQQIVIDLVIDSGAATFSSLSHPLFKLGFGKDKFRGTYKPVWLYNSSQVGRDDVTTCEVFDFSTNAWRDVTPSAPYRVIGGLDPLLVDGSLHWFTDCQEETKVVSLDLRTETFQVISKAPFANAKHRDIVMCNLDNRLCVSQMKWPNHAQVIWSFHSGNKTWHNLYSLDFTETSISYGIPTECALIPLALLDGEKKNSKKKKLLFYDGDYSRLTLVLHDPETKSYDAAFAAHFDPVAIAGHFNMADCLGYPVCYFPSLISI